MNNKIFYVVGLGYTVRLQIMKVEVIYFFISLSILLSRDSKK